jgi:dephospho-CoA kinase
MRYILCLHGLAGSGKDTIADYLVNTYNFKKLFFADALKKVVSIISGWSYDYLNGSTIEYRELRETVKHPIYGKTGRELLQYIGTEVFRNNFDENVWINIIKQEIENSDENIVVSDCRFMNEVAMLEQFPNVFFVNVRRPTVIHDKHISAQELVIDGGYVIDNYIDGIDALYNKVDKILAIIRKNEKENSLKNG